MIFLMKDQYLYEKTGFISLLNFLQPSGRESNRFSGIHIILEQIREYFSGGFYLPCDEILNNQLNIDNE